MDGTCDLGDQPHGRNWIITRIAPNLTIELCDDHEAIGLVNLTAVVLGVDPGRFYAAVEKFTKGEALRAAKELEKAQAAEHQAQQVLEAAGTGGHTQADADADGAANEQLLADAAREAVE